MEAIRNRFKRKELVPEVNHGHVRIIVIVLIVEFVLMSLMSGQFLTKTNLVTLARNFMENGFISLGMTFVIISGNIDLSVGGIVSLACITIGMINSATGNIALAAIAGMIVALLCGCLNGYIVGYLKVPSFIATLATSYLFRGLATGFSKAESFSGIPAGFTELGMGMFLGLPTQLWIFMILSLVSIILLNRTAYGRYVHVIGYNPRSAHFSGISVSKHVFSVFLLQAFLTGVATIVLVARVASARSSFGMDYETTAITAVVLGGTNILGGTGSIGGTILAVFILGIMRNGLTLAGVKAEWAVLAMGALLLLSILLSENSKGWMNIIKKKRERKVSV